MKISLRLQFFSSSCKLQPAEKEEKNSASGDGAD